VEESYLPSDTRTVFLNQLMHSTNSACPDQLAMRATKSPARRIPGAKRPERKDYFLLVLSLKIRGAIRPFPHAPSHHGASSRRYFYLYFHKQDV
jgi:hypothetical protein